VTGIGMKRTEPRKPMRRMSKKQAKRTVMLKIKKLAIMIKQIEFHGTAYCERGMRAQDGKCQGELELDHVIPRGRGNHNVDDYSNLQLLCSSCHRFKTNNGSGDEDFRDGRMICSMRTADEEARAEKMPRIIDYIREGQSCE